MAECIKPVFGQYPCGKCPACLARSRQEWVFRLREEYKVCDFGLFVTLTYRDETLPSDGVCLRDVQLFLKRLRKNWKSKTLRYFLVSEYGDHTFRPHYHALFFFKDLQRSNDIYDTIEIAWQNGNVQFGEIEEGSIVYCTKYCLKGSQVPKGMHKNFRLLSKMNGGIGIAHLEEKAEFYLERIDRTQIVRSSESHAPMPRYYRTKLLNTFSAEDKEQIKADYQAYLNDLKFKIEMKRRKQFEYKFRHKLANLDEVEADDLYWKWRDQIISTAAELTMKRTKKQSL